MADTAGPPRRPTLRDVAARAGTSTATASLALRGAPGPSAASAARVLRAAGELGYRADRAASLLAARRTRRLGVTLVVSNPFHAELVEELQDAADDAGYELLLAPVTRRRAEAAAVEVLLDSRCEALLLLGPELGADRLADLDHRAPVVLVGRRSGPDHRLDAVRAPDDAGMALAVGHLAALGHRAIVHVDGGDGEIAAARRDGFLAAAAAAGPGAHARVVAGEFSEAAGAAAARALLAEGVLAAGGSGSVTGVVAANDRVALGVLDVLAREGVAVPEAVSVVGYDDSPLARLAHVQLTSVSQDPRGQARAAVRTALERLDGGRPGGLDVLLEPRLVARATTGPAPTLRGRREVPVAEL